MKHLQRLYILLALCYAYLWRFFASLRPLHWGAQYFTMHDPNGMPFMLALATRRNVHNTNKQELDLQRIFWMRGPVSFKNSWPVKNSKTTIQT